MPLGSMDWRKENERSNQVPDNFGSGIHSTCPSSSKPTGERYFNLAEALNSFERTTRTSIKTPTTSAMAVK